MNAPTSFGLAFFLRIAFPGLVTLLLATPLLPVGVPINLTTIGLATVASLAGGAGLILFFLDTFFYQVFEGRILWPNRWRELKTAMWEKWLNARWNEITRLREMTSQLDKELSFLEEERHKRNVPEAPAGGDEDQKRSEKRKLDLELGLLYYRVMAFPFFQGDARPHALWPTAFGNVMASYEYYPEERYGMDSVFYWYRLWLVVPDDVRREYDNYWAAGQAWLYITAVSVVSGLTYGVLMLWAWIAWGLTVILSSVLTRGLGHQFVKFLAIPRASQRVASWLGITLHSWRWEIPVFLTCLTAVSVLLWAVTYWLAKEQHRSSGEFFKALFDLYREELEVQPFTVGAMGDWEDAADFLQYLSGGSVLGRRKPPRSAR